MRKIVLLDSACSSTVCGENWLSMYFASLDSDLQNDIKKQDGTRMFKFGGGECLKSIAQYDIPAYPGEKNSNYSNRRSPF